MIRYVYQPSRGRDRRARSAENYRGRFRLPGFDFEDVTLATTDKRVAEQRLEDLVRERQHEQAGIIAPKSLRDAAVKPITVHLQDYIADLQAKGRAKSYWRLIEVRVTDLASACVWKQAKDITPDSFVNWRSGQRDKMAAKTLNDYLDASCVLLNWMKRQGRILANPLAPVGKVLTTGKEKVKRRALSDAEVERLLSIAGPRRVVYLLAVLTGLRRGEIKGLRWGDVHLDAPKPFLAVRAATTKNHKDAVILLRDDLVAELRAIRPANASPTARVCCVPKPETVRVDLKAAGIVRIDAQGRKVDFHALRHTLATNLARGGVAPRVAMEVMRHSDMRLTAKTYTDAGLLPMADAMDKLPRYDQARGAQTLRATGTDAQPVAEMRSQKRSQTGVAERLTLSQSDEVTAPPARAKTPDFSGDCRDLSQCVAVGQTGQRSEGDGARTRNLSALALAPTQIDHQKRSQSRADSARDPQLIQLIEAWPRLTPDLRAAVLAIVRASSPIKASGRRGESSPPLGGRGKGRGGKPRSSRRQRH